jgi:hypothetical protein
MLDKIVGWFSSALSPSEAAGGGDKSNHQNNSPLSPVAGVSLEKYAELCAKMADTPNDTDAFAAVAEANGVSREDWQTARNGWNARMENTETAATVALAYMPLYQAALAEYGGEAATATLEEYIEMSAMMNSDLAGADARRKNFEAMYARFNINPQKWSQISTCWVDKLTKDPQLATHYSEKCRIRIKALDNEFLLQNNS